VTRFDAEPPTPNYARPTITSLRGVEVPDDFALGVPMMTGISHSSATRLAATTLLETLSHFHPPWRWMDFRDAPWQTWAHYARFRLDVPFS
jgi:hypothetical protein